MFRKIRAMMMFARETPWVEEPKWESQDAKALSLFLQSESGGKLRKILLNMVVRTNSQCIQNKKDLEFEAGFANGFKGAVASLEGLCNTELYGKQEDDAPDYSELMRQ